MKNKILSFLIAAVLSFSLLQGIASAANIITETVFEWTGNSDVWTLAQSTTDNSTTSGDWKFTAENGILSSNNSSYKHRATAFYNTAVNADNYKLAFHIQGNAGTAYYGKMPSNTIYVNYGSQTDHYYKVDITYTANSSAYDRIIKVTRYYGWNSSKGTYNRDVIGTYVLEAGVAVSSAYEYDFTINIEKEDTATNMTVCKLTDNGPVEIISAVDTQSVLGNGKIGFEAFSQTVMTVSGIKITTDVDTTFLEAYRLDGNGANWVLSGGAKLTGEKTKIENSWESTDLNMQAIYCGHWLSGTYKYTLSSSAGGSNNGNVNYIYFNYLDSKNYYRITQGSFTASGDTAPVQIHKVVDGETTLIGSYSAAHTNKNYLYTIIQQDGKIKITYTSGGVLHTPFEEFEVDPAISEGFIAVGTKGNKATFSSIVLYGQAEDVSLGLEASDITDGAVNIPISGYSTNLDFNYDLDVTTVDNLGIYIREKDSQTQLPESAYEIAYSPSTAPKRATVNFKETLEYKTDYEIVISSHLKSADYGSAMSVEDYTIGFTTIPPEFDANATVTIGGQPVTDVADCAGRTVDFSVALTNSGTASRDYIASVCVFGANGKLLTGKYFKGTVAVQSTDSTTVTGAVFVPVDGEKIIVYVWDGVSTMDVLYPCIKY